MTFSTEHSDALWWLMISGDVNANRGVLSFLDDPAWQEDLPRLVRGALGRQLRGHWNTTTANAWGVLALEKFSVAFESEQVTGQTDATLGTGTQSVQWDAAQDPHELDLPWADTPSDLSLTHQGTGRPWAMVQRRAALPLSAPLFTGYTVKRTVTPIEQQRPGVWTRGDVARVSLTINAQSDMTWVVLDDPIPAGASVLATGFGTTPQSLTSGERRSGYVYPAYEKKRFDAFRAYYQFVPNGDWTVEYTLRLNNPGNFQLPATRVEAMYAPEMFGELPNADFVIEPLP